MLRAHAVTVRYPGTPTPVLVRVDFAARKGELVAIVGPNGSGKTTLLRALLGLVPLDEGSVRIDDRALQSWTPASLARSVSVVPQSEDRLFPLKVDETVMLGRYARLGPLAPEGPDDHAAVETALRRSDVWELRNRRVDTLSGGEWQRVRIARALAQEPKALVLDEPTTALDVRHEMEVFELIRQLVNDGLAGVVVTHHLNLAARYAHRMVLLHQGEVVAEGTPTQVMRQEVLTGVFEWPVAVTTWCDGSPQVIPLRPGEAT